MDKEDLIASMVNRGILKTKSITEAFREVPREEFCTPEQRKNAYLDEALPIIANQTISQPTTVAMMTEALEPKTGQKILEIGAGSGYQAAILSKIVGKNGKIFTIERIPELVEFAKENLKKTGIKNVKIIEGDGTLGLEKEAPFDRIIVTAGAPQVPEKLKEQLKFGGVMVIPVGDRFEQEIFVIKRKSKTEFEKVSIGPFMFVPLIGKQGWS